MSTNDDSMLQAIWYDQLEQNDADKQLSETVKGTVERLSEIRDEYDKARRHIDGDGRLTSEGKKSDIANLAQGQAELARQSADVLLGRIAKEIAESETRLNQRQTVNADPVVREMRASEIRERFLELSELEIHVALTEAALVGNAEIVAAIRDAPVPMLTDWKPLRDAERAANETSNPETVARLEQLQRSESILRSALNGCLMHVGFAEQDPIKQIAEGETEAA